MKSWLFAMLSKNRMQVTQTFTANATWVAPITTSTIDSASGKGAAGMPGTPGTPSQTGWYEIATTTFFRRDGGTDRTASTGAPVFDGSSPPANYCDPTVTYSTSDSTVYSSSTTCYGFFTTTQPGTPGDPPTTGASTTAFGKTFPGGTGGAASTTTFSNIAVTPGGSYGIVVPSGGSLTFTYWK